MAHKTATLTVEDPALLEKIEAVIAAHKPSKATELPVAASAPPRFVFSRTTPGREPNDQVIVRNGLDEDRGGTVLAKIGRAYQVDVSGAILIVHEPEDSWEQ